MTARNPLVVINGTVMELPLGDTVKGAPVAGADKQVQFNNGGTLAGAGNVEIDNNDLQIKKGVPTTPPADYVKIFSQSLANRILPASIGPSGFGAALQPSMWRQKISRWNAAASTVLAPAIDGMPTQSVLGTPTLRSVATTNLLTRSRRLGYVSAETAASFCGHYGNSAHWTTGDGAGVGGFFYSCRFAASDAAAVSGARMFVGMRNPPSTPANAEFNSLANHIGVAQLSTDATQLFFVCRGSAGGSAMALGTNFPPMSAEGATNGVLYDLTIYAPPNSAGVVHMRLERVGTPYVAEESFSAGATYVPNATTLLAHSAFRTNNATALACGIDISSVYVETDY